MMEDIFNIGVDDKDTILFEGQYKVKGMRYNSYLIMDDKICVLDSVAEDFGDEWLKSIKETVRDRKVDYLLISHMESDHSFNIEKLVNEYPDITLVGNTQTFNILNKYFELNVNKLIVKNDEVLSLGKHSLRFIFAPMVHWPEVMMSYDEYSKTLFSADAFGKFDLEGDWDDKAAEYYFGIVGKYGNQVQNVLKKLNGVEINTICSLHGPVLEDNIEHYVNLYDKWSSYESEKKGVVIAYGSIYGNNKKACEYLYDKLKEKGTDVKIFNLALSDVHEVLSYAFRYDTLVLGSSTYNGDMFPCVKIFIECLNERNFQKRNVALIQSGSWAPLACKSMKKKLEENKEISIFTKEVTINGSFKKNDRYQLDELCEQILELY